MRRLSEGIGHILPIKLGAFARRCIRIYASRDSVSDEQSLKHYSGPGKW